MATYWASSAELPWLRGETEGVAFHGQVLLSGDKGGPEALRLKFEPTLSVYAHMHLTSQFQVLIGGTMDFPRDSLSLRPLGVHYTDHNTPYGPFSVGNGHDVLVLHPKQGGLMTMQNKNARREVNLDGRVLSGMSEDLEWKLLPGQAGISYKTLISSHLGPEVVVLECKSGESISLDASRYGRYEILLTGSMSIGEALFGGLSLRYVQGNNLPSPIRVGDEGATIMLLSFDKNSLEGGLTGEGIAVEAAEAMGRAI